MARRHTHHVRVVGKFVRIPEVLPDGKVRCPLCYRVFHPTATGGVRMHRDPEGVDCPFRGGGEASIDEVPPVVVPPHPPKRNAWVPRDPATPSRLDSGSNCEDCGKWLPGERRLCGQCSLAKGRRP